MYGMDVITWKESEIEKLEVGKNTARRRAPNTPNYVAIKALGGDMEWSMFWEAYKSYLAIQNAPRVNRGCKISLKDLPVECDEK